MRDSAEQKWLKFLLKILLPDGGYVAVFTRSSDDLVAYFDESMGEGRLPMTSVAGYLFEPEAYQEFDSGMRTLLRDHQLPYFRMQDCIHLTGPFKRWRNLNPKSPIPEIVEREVIRLTRKYAILGVGVAMSDAKYVLLQPASMEVLMGGTYRTLCQWCLAEIGDWADRNRFHGKIAYFFEAGCTSQKDACGFRGMPPPCQDR